MAEKSADATAIRPFTIETPQADLDDLRARIVATRFPEKETVEDQSQGARLATMQALARYWATEHDWHECEAKLRARTATSSPRSTGWTSISFTFAPSMRTRCRSSSCTDGPARSSSS